LKLIAPPQGADIWLYRENVDGVAGYTKDGDILLPVAAIEQCEAVRARWKASP
jgi:hypothetical protein